MADVLRAVGVRCTAGRFSDGATTSESGLRGFVAAEAFFLCATLLWAIVNDVGA